MNRTLLGAFAALLLATAGLFWWQGRAATEVGEAPPQFADVPPEGLPGEDGSGQMGAAPPEANEATKEQRRFDRLDRNRDGKITRVEMLTPRVAQFRKLDTDGNNLLSFEEWAVKTSNRFKGADRNGDNNLDRAEFATTKPKPAAKPVCKCAPVKAVKAAPGKKPAPQPAPSPVDEDDDGDGDGAL